MNVRNYNSDWAFDINHTAIKGKMKREEERLMRKLEIGNLSDSLKFNYAKMKNIKPKVQLFDSINLNLVKKNHNRSMKFFMKGGRN